MDILQHLLHESALFQSSFYMFVLSFVLYSITYILYIKAGKGSLNPALDKSKKVFGFLASLSFFIAFALNASMITVSWIELGRPPFKSLYETLIYSTFTISFVYVVLERFFKFKILGLLVSILVIGVFIYALTEREAEAVALMPALQTPIMVPHVTSYFFAYAGIFIAALSAIFSLIVPKGAKGYWFISDKESINFEGYTYSIAKFAFLFLTFGLLLGSWWGQVAWSNYWGWDPKENWALISWLTFAGYFHLKHINTWSEKRLAWIVIIGALAILFTYLGMKYLPKDVQSASMHIYIEQ